MAPNIGTAEVSAAEDAYSVDTKDTDAEKRWSNANWTQWFAYYKQIPELQSVINVKATYTIGEGFKGEEETLSKIKGWKGGDTFDRIIENMLITNQIGGDAYAEIIRDKSGKLINLKPLNPGNMVHVSNDKGILKRFEQSRKDRSPLRFKIDDIFYLPRNRVADDTHGTSLTEKLVNIILMRNEAMKDMKTLMHRHVKPFFIFELNTDDATKIKAFKAQKDAASEGAENIYVAMGSVKATQVAMQGGAIAEARAWIDQLNNYFFQASGVPKVLLGDVQGTSEAGVKMSYFAFQQTTAEGQAEVVLQIKQQLGLTVTLPKPASLEKDLQTTERKEGNPLKPADSKATLGGKQV